MGSKRFIRSSKPNWPSSFLPQNHQEEVESSTVKAAEKSPPKAKVATPGRGGPCNGPRCCWFPQSLSGKLIDKGTFKGEVYQVKTWLYLKPVCHLSASEIRIKMSQEAPSEVLTCALNGIRMNPLRLYIFTYLVLQILYHTSPIILLNPLADEQHSDHKS